MRGLETQEGLLWTTREARELERQILTLAQKGQGVLPPLLENPHSQTHLVSGSLKPEHEASLNALLSSKDVLQLIQGHAGTGKTTLLQHLSPWVKEAGFELLCLAPTHSAVKEIRARGLAADTLERFLLQHRSGLGDKKMQKPTLKQFIVVDEASMTSNTRLWEYLTILDKTGHRGLAIGDIHQYGSPEGGKPFELLHRAGITPLYLTQIDRQENPVLKEAVKATYQKDFSTAFLQLKASVMELSPPSERPLAQATLHETALSPEEARQERLKVVAHRYLVLSPQEQAGTLVMTLTNRDRTALNELIQAGLREQNFVAEGVQTQVLVPRDLTRAERSHLLNYHAGDILRFKVGAPTQSRSANPYWQVVAKDTKAGVLTLKNQDGQACVWVFDGQKAAQGVEVFREAPRAIGKGDFIHWRRSDVSRNVFSADLAEVTRVWSNEHHELQVELQPLRREHQALVPNGEKKVVNVSERAYQHWDLAYAITSFSAQSKTAHRAILYAESQSLMATQASFLVGLTRAVQEFQLYTDHKDALLQHIETHTGAKRSSLEALGELQSPAPKRHEVNDKGPLSPALHTAHVHSSTVNLLKSQAQPKATAKEPAWLDSRTVLRLLTERTEEVALRMLGEPKSRRGKLWSYGRHQGSLKLTVQGDKRGFWYDHQTGQGGHLVSLVAEHYRLDLKENYKAVLEASLEVLGMTDSAENPLPKASAFTRSPKSEFTLEEQKSIQKAEQLAKTSVPLPGTLAERYLKEHRGIQLKEWPDTVRFHPAIQSHEKAPSRPALLVIGKDAKGHVKSAQAIYLDPKTAQKAEIAIPKQTFGKPSLVPINLSPRCRKNGPVYLAEGPETALSILMAKPDAQVRAMLGKANFKTTFETSASKVVLCLDHDKYTVKQKGKPQETVSLHQDVSLQKAILAWQEKGKEVLLAQPESAKDYNDVIKTKGKSAILANLREALPADILSLKDVFSSTLADYAKKNDLPREALNQPMQKTEFSSHSLTNAAFQEGKKILSKQENNLHHVVYNWCNQGAKTHDLKENSSDVFSNDGGAKLIEKSQKELEI